MAKSKRGGKGNKVKQEEDVKPVIKTDLDEELEIKPIPNNTGTKDPNNKVMKKRSKPKGKQLRYFSKSDKGNKEKAAKGVVYVSSLPHGFYEKQLEGYFGQFGKVSGVYVPKSKKTGRAKGYAFIEFIHPEVAQIAAETMNNYLMFNRLIKTKLIPPEKQRPYMFSDHIKQKKHQYSESKVAQSIKKRRRLITKQRDSYITRSVKKLTRIQESLKSMGVDYKIKVAGLNEGVKLTAIKNLDPESEEVTSKLKRKDSTVSKNEAAIVKKKKGKKSTSSKVAPTTSTKLEPQEAKSVTTVALTTPVAKTRDINVKKVAKVIAKQQIAVGKEKIAKLAKAISNKGKNSKAKAQSNPLKKTATKLQSGKVTKAKNATSPAKRKRSNPKPKLETTV